MSDVRAKMPKLYKNPHRKESEPDVGHYTPQYKKMGLTPEKIGGDSVAGNVMILKNKQQENNNPRTRIPTIRQQPYAESIPDKFINTIPNVGNSMDHTWSGVDGEIIDDLDVDPNSQMIDNNMMDPDELEVRDDEVYNPALQLDGTVKTGTESKDLDINGLDSILSVDEGQFILLIDDAVVAVGDKDYILNLASSLIFGEHEVCDGNPVPVDNISILKKMPIKVGLFLE